LYGAGGNSGAKYQNDYIELFNRSSSPVTLTNYSLAFFTATGTSPAGTLLLRGDATIPAGGYYLVQLAGGTTGAVLPAPDQTGTYNLSGTSGRVDLLLSGSLLERVGYGTSATTYEGTGPAPAPSATVALFRALGGCTDANSNDKDFTTAAPAPRNAGAVGNNCNGPAPTLGSFAPAMGPVGSTFTLSGSGFTSSAAVTVGSVAATSITCSSPTTLTVTVPAGANSGPITVTTATGLATSADSYTVTVPVITAPASLPSLVATQGSASPVLTYQVSGSSLDGSTLVIKSSTTSLEVSLDGLAYAQTATLALNGAATLGPTTVYVRVVSGTALSSFSGNLANTNDPTTSTVAVSGAVVAPIVAKRWLGTAGTNSWFDASNWEGGVLPGPGDDVVLDHRYVAGKYTVTLGNGSTAPTAVSVASLRLRPSSGDSILFTLPSSNTVSDANASGPALQFTRSTAGDTALVIGKRAFFTNASGASGGTVLDAAGTTNPTVFILNGGSFRQQTIRGVTGLLENLSAAAGTEAGNFYYRIPGTGSTTVSLAGRTYGNLTFQFLRNGNNTAINYGNSGGTPLTINGSLTIESGATLSYNILANLVLRGNLLNMGTFRMAPNNASTTVRLVLQGTTPQVLAGTPLGDPSAGNSYLDANSQLELSNPAGATLQLPLTLSNALVLSTGLLTTDASNVLTLGAAATVQGGSDASFVSGPVQRPVGPTASATSYVFPVGKGHAYRPLTLTVNTQTGTTVYRAEQFEGNPVRTLASTDPNGALTRVSQVRYFTLTPFTTGAVPVVSQPVGFTGNVRLTHAASDGVSDPAAATLVVAKRSDATQPWYNFGRAGYTGTASAGTITSGSFTSFSDFALASTDPAASANPLPVQLVQFAATRTSSGDVALGWTTASELHSDHFEVERSADGQRFERVATVAARGTCAQPSHYAAHDAAAPTSALYYRLRQLDQDGTAAYSPTVLVAAGPAGELILAPNPTHDQLQLLTEQPLAYVVRTPLGQAALAGTTAAGISTIQVGGLPAGVYLLELRTGAGRVVRRFVKE